MEKQLDFDIYLMILQKKNIDNSSGNMDCMLCDRKYTLLALRTGNHTVEYGRQKLTFKNGKTVFVTAHRDLCIKQISSLPNNFKISPMCHNSQCIFREKLFERKTRETSKIHV